MKKILLPLLILVAALPACKKSSSSAPAGPKIMFVHGCAAGATTVSLDGKINNVTVTGASNIQFLKNSGYQQTTAVTGAKLSFFVTGLNLLDSTTVDLANSKYYSAFASGSITAPGIVFVEDNMTAPASGMAKVRFVNLSPDGLTTSCYVGTTKVDSNVAYKAVTSFHEVTATTAKISMVDQVVLANSGSINSQGLVAGKLYTFIFTGTAAGSGTSVLTLTAINNN